MPQKICNLLHNMAQHFFQVTFSTSNVRAADMQSNRQVREGGGAKEEKRAENGNGRDCDCGGSKERKLSPTVELFKSSLRRSRPPAEGSLHGDPLLSGSGSLFLSLSPPFNRAEHPKEEQTQQIRG